MSLLEPCLFTGYPYYVYVLIDDVQGADSIKLVTAEGTTTLPITFFTRKGVYELPVPDTTEKIFDIKIYAGYSGESDQQIIETIDCISKSKCDGIYMRWENDLAGYDYWLFSGNERDRIRSGTRESFEPFIEDIENETGNFEILKKRFEKTIRVFTSFPKNNAEGFNQLARSRFVEMWHDDKWWKVDVDINSLSVSKFQPYGKCSLDITIPNTYLK